jgi:hypothetical protein
MSRSLCAALCFALAACASAPKSSSEQPGAEKSDPAKANAEKFQATLSSTGEVPPPTVGSAAPTGTATFVSDGTSVTYTVTASGLTSDYTAAHIHSGGPGVAGPAVVPLNLAAGPTPGSAGGQGSFDASAIKGKNADGSPMTMADLLKAMRSGSTYVNVHTTNNKAGEIRGAIGP